jgi:hypothetical protein
MLASTVTQVDFEDVGCVEFERLVSAAPAFETPHQLASGLRALLEDARPSSAGKYLVGNAKFARDHVASEPAKDRGRHLQAIDLAHVVRV